MLMLVIGMACLSFTPLIVFWYTRKEVDELWQALVVLTNDNSKRRRTSVSKNEATTPSEVEPSTEATVGMTTVADPPLAKETSTDPSTTPNHSHEDMTEPLVPTVANVVDATRVTASRADPRRCGLRHLRAYDPRDDVFQKNKRVVDMAELLVNVFAHGPITDTHKVFTLLKSALSAAGRHVESDECDDSSEQR